MTPAEIAATADDLLGFYFSALLVDPFCRVKVEVVEGDFVSVCALDTAPLTWTLKLNPVRHKDEHDVQYSVIEGLLQVLFYQLDIAASDKTKEARQALVSRLATAVAGFLPLNSNEDETEESQPNEE